MREPRQARGMAPLAATFGWVLRGAAAGSRSGRGPRRIGAAAIAPNAACAVMGPCGGRPSARGCRESCRGYYEAGCKPSAGLARLRNHESWSWHLIRPTCTCRSAVAVPFLLASPHTARLSSPPPFGASWSSGLSHDVRNCGEGADTWPSEASRSHWVPPPPPHAASVETAVRRLATRRPSPPRLQESTLPSRLRGDRPCQASVCSAAHRRSARRGHG